jgi:hypothetical protein
MDHRITTLEKAFELARSGNCQSLTYLTKKLKHEGFDVNQIEGKALRKQLLKLIKETAQGRSH